MGGQSSRTGFNKDCYTSDNSSHLLHIYPSEYKGLEEAYHHYHHHNHYEIFTTVNPPSQIVSPHPRKLIHISESGKFLLVESRILGFGIRNYATGIQVPLARSPDAGMTSMESSIQDISYMGRIVVFNHSSKYSLHMPDAY